MFIELHHLRDNHVTYVQHLVFALKIVSRMWLSSHLLFVHAFIPIFRVPRPLRFRGMTDYLNSLDH